jgi:hypothetical protein
MWGKSQLNRRNIVLVAMTTAATAFGVAGQAQAQTAQPSPIPTRAESMTMLGNRLERLKDPEGNYPQDESTARCARTATAAGRKCSVVMEYPNMRCTDSSVMTSFNVSSTGTRKAVITGLKLRCVRTIDLTDDEETTEAPAPVSSGVAVPAQPAEPAAAPAAPAETAEQRAAREREAELKAIEEAMLREERGER